MEAFILAKDVSRHKTMETAQPSPGMGILKVAREDNGENKSMCRVPCTETNRKRR